MILLTANRSMKGKDSLEQVMREENTSKSLPVLTVSHADRLLNDSEYRVRCIESLIEIVLDMVLIGAQGGSSFRNIKRCQSRSHG